MARVSCLIESKNISSKSIDRELCVVRLLSVSVNEIRRQCRMSVLLLKAENGSYDDSFLATQVFRIRNEEGNSHGL